MGFPKGFGCNNRVNRSLLTDQQCSFPVLDDSAFLEGSRCRMGIGAVPLVPEMAARLSVESA